MVELEVFHSHLYPGARGRLPAAAKTEAGGTLVAAFADGSRSTARLFGDRLDVAGYRTAAGRPIEAKAWTIADAPDGTFRVTARAGG